MKIKYELFNDLHTDSDYRVTTILTLDKNNKTWALYWIYCHLDTYITDDLEIDEETALKLLKESHISSVEIVKENQQ